MILVAIGWIYVVTMMAIAEATASSGTVLGAFFTFMLYGVLPLSIVLYVMGTPGRKRRLRAKAAEEESARRTDPDCGDHAPGDPVAPERKEP